MKAQQDTISESGWKLQSKQQEGKKKKKPLHSIKQNVKGRFWSEKFKTKDNKILSLEC